MAILRKVEKLENNEWIITKMEFLKKEDHFRLTEPNETEPFYEGTAISNSYETGPGIWGIRTK